ncbi:MAG: tyrosine/serine/threonine protein phosphatase pps1 [Peltula sp. TS41687]|nr:MAG: tyrosine/serine/threonine protein phosphatase pps1 [Peltula sp. TS41687]
MATIVARPIQIGQPSGPPTTTTTLKLKTPKAVPVPTPNKHLQPLSPGIPPVQAPETPPASPPTKSCDRQPPTESYIPQTSSLLYPPTTYKRVLDSPRIYSIDAEGFAAAINHISSRPLPGPRQVFPWLHGLHPQNQTQLTFFVARRRSQRKAPKCLREITIVKVGGDLTTSRIKGAIAPSEILHDGLGVEPSFLDIDPVDGFSVRNFHIQPCKMATVSDIVIYGDENAKEVDYIQLAKKIAAAQRIWRSQESPGDKGPTRFNTFILSTPFREFEASYPELVAIDSTGTLTEHVMDFFRQERTEMCEMSRASEIAKNVWLGPTPEDFSEFGNTARSADHPYDVLIEATDLAPIPEARLLKGIADALREWVPQVLDFPSSGSIMSPVCSDVDIAGILNTCKWIHNLADPETSDVSEQEHDLDGDVTMSVDPPQPRKILIHCMDGYTETSLLALVYLMYVDALPVHEAWLRLHCEKKRNFFAYPTDASLLMHFQPQILEASPKRRDMLVGPHPPWLLRMDGSLPSRILPYMYLGNLGHARNPELLRAIGIGQVLSVGESVFWPWKLQEKWGLDNLMRVDNVQDNGIDTLTDEFSRCLDFIERGKLNGTATLVHCRVGVSRSATICIAEIMRTLGLSFPRAYCFVRARRLNVIIQPHLRFSYELLKWEESRQIQENRPVKRELEWATIAREIALMNKPYSR